MFRQATRVVFTVLTQVVFATKRERGSENHVSERKMGRIPIALQ